jgi:very-short-patch-repair endonuclease
VAALRSTMRAVARSQYHVISRDQARAIGALRWHLADCVSSGEWEWATDRVLRLVGGRRSFEQRCITSVLHTGGCLCGESTLALCKIPGFGLSAPLHLAVRRGTRWHPLPKVVIHEVRSLPEHHLMVINGIRSVTPTRAIYDIAARHHWEKVRRTLMNTWRRKWTSGGLLHQMGPEWLGRGRAGTVAMRELLAVTADDYSLPDSNLEDRLCSIIEGAGFPRPKRQVNLGNDSRWIGRVDVKDPELSLIGEVDSETFHFAPIDGDDDAARDRAFGAAGFTVVRWTEHEIWHEPGLVVARWRDARAKCQAKRGL